MAGLAPTTIVLALGAGALGGPDALRLLLQAAGRSPLHDILTCVLAMAAVTAHVLGTALLARFVRKARAGGGGAVGAPATDLFACVTATMSVGAALLVTACLLAGSGGLGALRLAFGFAAKNPVGTVTVLVIAAPAPAATVGGFFPYTMPLLRCGRRAGTTAGGASPGGGRAASQTLSLVGALLVGCVAISAAFLLSFLSESSPSPGSTGGAQAARSGDPAAEAVPLAAATFFAAVTFLYVHLRRGGRRRIPEEALFVLCGSVALLDLSLPAQQPGPLQGPQLGAAAARVLPPAAVATFFLAVTLIYARGHAAGADANQQNPAAAELLEKLTLAAALFTCVLSLFAAALVLDTK